MQTSSIKKISILGLVLSAASAVTAAILPSNAFDSQPDIMRIGSLTQHSSVFNAGNESSLTCAPTMGGIMAFCFASTNDGSSTSVDGIGSSTCSSTGGGFGEGAGVGETTDAN